MKEAIRSTHVVTPQNVRAACILFEDGRITSVENYALSPHGISVQDFGDAFILPRCDPPQADHLAATWAEYVAQRYSITDLVEHSCKGSIEPGGEAAFTILNPTRAEVACFPSGTWREVTNAP